MNSFSQFFAEAEQSVHKVVPTDRTQVPDFVDKAFNTLAINQRDQPENAMLNATMFMGGGLLSFCLEHVGDLTHRMAQHPRSFSGGQEYVAEKVRRCLRYLTSDYGFEKEVGENIQHNFEYDPKGFATIGEYYMHIKRLCKEYADEHRKLVVYNQAQWFARQAAIDLGEGRYKHTIVDLVNIRQMLDSGKWSEYALTYYLGDENNLVPYNPGIDKSTGSSKI